MTEDKKKDEILVEAPKDKDKKEVNDPGGDPKIAEDASPKEASAGKDVSLDTPAESTSEPGKSLEPAGASAEEFTDAPAEKAEEMVETPGKSPAEPVAATVEAATGEEFSKPVSTPAEPVKSEELPKPVSEPGKAAVEAATSEEFSKPVSEPEKAAPKAGESPKAPEKGRADSKPSETVKDGFKPHYQEGGGSNLGVTALLWLLLILFGVGIVGTTIQAAIIDKVDFALPIGIVAIIWVLIMFPLWKKISLEVKVGLEVVAMGVMTALAYTVYQSELVFPGVPAGIFLPALFCLMLLVVLVSVWMIWPRFFWLPIALSVLVLLGAVAPVWTLVLGGKDLAGLLQSPSFGFWPHLAGWVMAQIIFPVGVLLLLALQVKNLFNSKQKKHVGYFLWALGLALIWTAPLGALDRVGQPVFPAFGQFADQTFGITPEKPAEEPVAATAQESEASTTDVQPEAPASDVTAPVEPKPLESEGPAPGAKTDAPPVPVDESADQPAPAEPTEAESAASLSAAPAPDEDASPASEPVPGKAAPVEQPAVTQAEIEQLRTRVQNLETELADLKEKVGKQDRLIQDLFIWLADKFREDVKSRTRLPISDVSPAINMMDHAQEEPAAEEPATPPVGQPGPAPDQPGTPADQPGPAPDQPGTPADQPGPAPDQPETPADQSGPAADQPGSAPDQPGPPTDQPSEQSTPKNAT